MWLFWERNSFYLIDWFLNLILRFPRMKIISNTWYLRGNNFSCCSSPNAHTFPCRVRFCYLNSEPFAYAPSLYGWKARTFSAVRLWNKTASYPSMKYINYCNL
jgi:hypothetical protein